MVKYTPTAAGLENNSEFSSLQSSVLEVIRTCRSSGLLKGERETLSERERKTLSERDRKTLSERERAREK